MPVIKIVDHQQREHFVEFKVGDNLLDLLDDIGLPLRSDCGGLCACVTCHVYVVTPGRYCEPDPEELAMLTQVEQPLPNKSRLACEIKMTEQMAGTTIHLAPGSEII